MFTTGFLEILPFGNLFSGALTGHLGVTNALFGGICCILGAYLFSRQLPQIIKIVHPIYAELGLLPQSNKG
ncbi:MAG: hypothetical protein V7K48_25745 [Nostoc sp.]|uniref:hypothetical protein n=1 Tax=Nostoc sp. TaxID=1180 RepID=UPI002FF9BE05